MQFIPLAEECGLIMPLGAWVMRRACTDAATWPDDKLVAVNLSPAQFRHADLAKEILAVLKETGLPADRLELEVTESLLIDDPDRVLATLLVLKEAGVRISLDDFGTGYSSLSYLQRFPFDKIKIDRSFVAQMEKNADSMSIIRAVIALGKSLQDQGHRRGRRDPRRSSTCCSRRTATRCRAICSAGRWPRKTSASCSSPPRPQGPGRMTPPLAADPIDKRTALRRVTAVSLAASRLARAAKKRDGSAQPPDWALGRGNLESRAA